MFKVRMPFYEMAGEIGSATEQPSVVAEGQESSDEGSAPTSVQESSNPSATDDVVKQESFAKRLKEEREKILSEERAKWEAEQADKFKDYDVSKKALEYLMRKSNIDNPLTLKEQIELAELEEKAERENLTVEELQRRQELEELKAWKAQVESEKQQQQAWQEFEQTLKDFCKDKEIDGKPLDHMELWTYMHENGASKPEVAYKAMRSDYLEQQVANAEKEGVKKFLSAKGSIPTVEGKTAAGVATKEPPKTFNDALSRAKQRLANWGNMEG